MDIDLKKRLMEHPLVETIIIFLLPRISAQTEIPSWTALNAELDTYGITLIGNGPAANSYTYSMDPFYAQKKEEYEKSQLNETRKRKRDEIMEGIRKRTAIDPPVPRRDDLFGYAGIHADTNPTPVPVPVSSNSSSSSSAMDTDTDDHAMNAWAGSSEEAIQSFVDDRLRLVIYGNGMVSIKIRAFRFILGRPIEE